MESKLLEFHHQIEYVSILVPSFFTSGLVKIESDVMHIHSRYKILSAHPDESDRQLAMVKQKSVFTTSKFDIESIYGQYSTKRTDTWGSAFAITKEGREVATINTKFFSKSSAIKVQIIDNENQPFILALALVLVDFSDQSRVYTVPIVT